MTEQEIADILSRDLSVGTEAFRDELLTRCLAVLGSGSESAVPAMPRSQGTLLEFDLPDDRLELLAAAGDMARALGVMPAEGVATNA